MYLSISWHKVDQKLGLCSQIIVIPAGLHFSSEFFPLLRKKYISLAILTLNSRTVDGKDGM